MFGWFRRKKSDASPIAETASTNPVAPHSASQPAEPFQGLPETTQSTAKTVAEPRQASAAPGADRPDVVPAGLELETGPQPVPAAARPTEEPNVTSAAALHGSGDQGSDTLLDTRRRLAALGKPAAVPSPRPGMEVIEKVAQRLRRARISKVQAGGRRIVAQVDESARSYGYTKRADGTYRLENAPVKTAPMLILTPME